MKKKVRKEKKDSTASRAQPQLELYFRDFEGVKKRKRTKRRGRNGWLRKKRQREQGKTKQLGEGMTFSTICTQCKRRSIGRLVERGKDEKAYRGERLKKAKDYNLHSFAIEMSGDDEVTKEMANFMNGGFGPRHPLLSVTVLLEGEQGVGKGSSAEIRKKK